MKYYVLAIYRDAKGIIELVSVIGTEGYETIKDARASVRWMKRGGFDSTSYVIGKPVKTVPGKFRVQGSGMILEPERGVIPTSEWSDFLRGIWPDSYKEPLDAENP